MVEPTKLGTSTSALCHTKLRVVVRPALGRAEQLDELLARLRVVGAPRGLDHHLHPERDGVDRAPAGLADVDVEVERRRRGVAVAGRGDHGELRVGRRGTGAVGGQLGAHAGSAPARSSSKKPDTAFSTSGPPEMPAPVGLDQPHERVAAIDRRDREGGRVREPVDDQRLGVGLEVLQHRVEPDQPAPRGEVQLALGRPGRARVHRHHAVGRAAAQEEGQADRQLEAGPELVGQVEALQPQRAHAHRAVRGVARAQRPAALARAHDLPLVEVEHVAVVVGHAEAAQVAVLVRLRLRCRLGSAGKPAQPRDRLRALAAGDRGVEIQAAVHGDRATRTTSPSRNSGTGSSWRPSESSERPARGRKKLRLHPGQLSAPALSSPPRSGASQAAQRSR